MHNTSLKQNLSSAEIANVQGGAFDPWRYYCEKLLYYYPSPDYPVMIPPKPACELLPYDVRLFSYYSQQSLENNGVLRNNVM